MQDTGFKYVKYGPYAEAIPNTGNIPYGQQEISFQEFINIANNAKNETKGLQLKDWFDRMRRENPQAFQPNAQSGITMLNGVPTQISAINPATGKVDINPQLAAQGSAGIGAIPGFSTPTGGIVNQEAFSNYQQSMTPKPIGNGIPSVTPTPTLPQGSATQTYQAFYGSLASDVQNARMTLEQTYQKQLDDLNNRQANVQTKIDQITSQQEGALGEVDKLTEPFRAKLEEAERERLYINKNFEANQKLTNELDSLLSEGNNLVQQMKGVTGLQGIRNPRINQAIEAVNSRVGVIQAVMSARSGQIAEGYRMIDRSVDAMNADRKDRLDYYDSLLNFYESQKTSEGNKLITLEKDEKDFLTAQINLIENDLARSQATADALKQAMTDPDTALAYAQAGVTLNDTPEQINAKLATYGYSKEVSDMANDMAMKGYTALFAGQKAPSGSEVVTTTDSKGKTKSYYTEALASGSNLGTESERQSNAFGTINQILALPPDRGYVDANGYITAQGFKDLVNAAREDNISRSDFLDQYAYLLYPNGGKAYGLTAKEMEDYGIKPEE